MAKVIGIAIKGGHRHSMQQLSSVEITEENGLAGDYCGRGGLFGKRQVTILSLNQWNMACQELGELLPWSMRRANLCIDGFLFEPGDLGKILRIGTAKLQITGETKPCRRMDEAYPGLKRALKDDWRAGVTCRVIEAGTVELNSQVQFIEN